MESHGITPQDVLRSPLTDAQRVNVLAGVRRALPEFEPADAGEYSKDELLALSKEYGLGMC